MFESFGFWGILGGLIGGSILGSIVTYTVQKRFSSSGSGNAVDQNRAKAGGDIVGRDKKH